jgi:hypothetical protein
LVVGLKSLGRYSQLRVSQAQNNRKQTAKKNGMLLISECIIAAQEILYCPNAQRAVPFFFFDEKSNASRNNKIIRRERLVSR